MPEPARHPVHVIIPTHTTRWLAECLAGLAAQATAPASVTLTCDVSDNAIEEVAEAWAPRIGAPFHLVMREHAGEPRLNQVRNNGLRALIGEQAPGDHEGVVVLDGDTVLEPRAIEKHAALFADPRRFGLVVAFRVYLTEQESRAVDAEAIARGEGLPLSPEDRERLAARQKRYRRQVLLKRLGLVKAHKPKVIGGHHAARLGVLRAVNGYDEEYRGYGYDDDDLSRRIHGLRPRVRPAIAIAGPAAPMAFHLWHPTRAPGRPTETPGYERFRRGGPVRAAHGLESPLPQPEPSVRHLG